MKPVPKYERYMASEATVTIEAATNSDLRGRAKNSHRKIG